MPMSLATILLPGGDSKGEGKRETRGIRKGRTDGVVVIFILGKGVDSKLLGGLLTMEELTVERTNELHTTVLLKEAHHMRVCFLKAMPDGQSVPPEAYLSVTGLGEVVGLFHPSQFVHVEALRNSELLQESNWIVRDQGEAVNRGGRKGSRKNDHLLPS